MWKDLLKLFLISFATFFFLYITEAFKPQKVTFETSINPAQRKYKIAIINQLERIDETSIVITFFTKVVSPTAVVTSGGRRYVLKGECTSDTPFVFIFDKHDTSAISLKPSDTVSVEACLQDTTVDIGMVKKPEVCLSCNNFPSICSTDRQDLFKRRILGVGLFAVLLFMTYHKLVLNHVNKNLRAGIFYYKYRKKRKKNCQEAEEFFVKELTEKNINALCFFYLRYEGIIRKNIEYLSPYMERKDENDMFTAIVHAILQRLPKYDYSCTTVTSEVTTLAAKIIIEIWKTKYPIQ